MRALRPTICRCRPGWLSARPNINARCFEYLQAWLLCQVSLQEVNNLSSFMVLLRLSLPSCRYGTSTSLFSLNWMRKHIDIWHMSIFFPVTTKLSVRHVTTDAWKPSLIGKSQMIMTFCRHRCAEEYFMSVFCWVEFAKRYGRAPWFDILSRLQIIPVTLNTSQTRQRSPARCHNHAPRSGWARLHISCRVEIHVITTSKQVNVSTTRLRSFFQMRMLHPV